ncbi:response regulator [Alginatibacterium sediminis]|uniref:Response regulator n=1 Tax=Alginatibacterium sediminis TaxID=2164068 RepID=A0A420EI36_9ALTE|nr:response regulator [Alginatibacterium sediminis]RKF20216.1 response regulator [Alginatibacterium sediminis]
MSDIIRTLVVDDHPLMRKGVVQFLQAEDDFEVVAEASDGAAAIDLAQEHDFDLILLDLNMKGLSGFDTLKMLREKDVNCRIIILTVSDSKNDVIRLINAGADGYLLKDMDPDALVSTLRQAIGGQQAISEQLIPYLDCLDDIDDFHHRLEDLTRRELQTLQHIARGLSNREVADALNITEGTVKVHVKSLLRKLKAKSRVEMTVMYLEHLN